MMGLVRGIQVRILFGKSDALLIIYFPVRVSSEVLYQNNTEGTLQTNWLGKNRHIQMERYHFKGVTSPVG